MVSYQFYYFLTVGSTFDNAVLVRAKSPQEACKIYFSSFPRSPSGSYIALFVSDSLIFSDRSVCFLKVIR